MSDLQARMNQLNAHIEKCHARCRELLGASEAQIAEGLALHERTLVCDSFGFTPNVLSRAAVERLNRCVEEQWRPNEMMELQLDLRATSICHDEDAFALYRRMFEAAGVDATVNTVGVGPSLTRALQGCARFTQVCDLRPDFWEKAITPEDARAAVAEGRHAMIFSANNPPAHVGFDDGFDIPMWLECFWRWGFRVMHLTYNRRNFVGDGCTEPSNAGLSAFGFEVVELMNALGIMIDTPHSGIATTLDACRASQAPVAATHTVCRDLSGHPRGKTDEQLRAIADTGGFVGITCIPYFLAERGTIVDLLEHIQHAVDVMGIDHVGIGTDTGFSAPPPTEPEMLPLPRGRNRWWSLWPEGTSNPHPDHTESHDGSLAWVAWPYFTVGLKMRGFSDEDVAKIAGGNILRVLGDVQAAATGL